jgi:hypothetical protein
VRVLTLILIVAAGHLVTSAGTTGLEGAVALWQNLVLGFSLGAATLLAGLVALGRRPAGGAPPAFLEEDGAASFRCPVCSTEGSGPRLVCSCCETPHHVECATYNGGCAIYGCAGAPRPSLLEPATALEPVPIRTRPRPRA